MAYRWSSNILIVALWLLSSSGCDESLPPRTDPSNILRAALAPPHEVIEMEDQMPIRGAGSFIASLKNLYDDVLQKEARIQGYITVWKLNKPEERRTVQFTVLQLAYPSLTGDLITLLPQDSARFLVGWDQRTDQGAPFWQGERLTQMITGDGDVYWDSDPIDFVAQVSVQLFDNVQSRTSSPIRYRSLYRLFGSIGEHD